MAMGGSVYAKQVPNCLPSHKWLIHQFNELYIEKNVAEPVTMNYKQREQALMQNWKRKYLWNTACVTFSILSAAHWEPDHCDFQLHDAVLQFQWRSLETLISGALAFFCKEHPHRFCIILFNFKQKGASTKKIKAELQLIRTRKDNSAI